MIIADQNSLIGQPVKPGLIRTGDVLEYEGQQSLVAGVVNGMCTLKTEGLEDVITSDEELAQLGVVFVSLAGSARTAEQTTALPADEQALLEAFRTLKAKAAQADLSDFNRQLEIREEFDEFVDGCTEMLYVAASETGETN